MAEAAGTRVAQVVAEAEEVATLEVQLQLVKQKVFAVHLAIMYLITATEQQQTK
jgi:hypothetical protein